MSGKNVASVQRTTSEAHRKSGTAEFARDTYAQLEMGASSGSLQALAGAGPLRTVMAFSCVARVDAHMSRAEAMWPPTRNVRKAVNDSGQRVERWQLSSWASQEFQPM